MKLSTKGRYAARAMLELAKDNSEGPLQIKEIAKRQGISIKYLERIMSRLAAAGLVISLRGLHGGFTLARAPEDIALLDVLNASDENLILVDCIKEDACCERGKQCVMNTVWRGLYRSMENYLGGLSLADLVHMEDDLKTLN
jgi:Rrf2 family protein